MRRLVVAVSLLALLACSVSSAFAKPRPPAPKTWYVSIATGKDKNSGQTPAKAFRTIALALSSATSGDTVQIATGTYAESLSLTGLDSLTIRGGWNTAFTIFNPAASPTTLLGNGTASSIGVDIQNCSSITLVGLEITGFDRGVFTSNTDTSTVNVAISQCRLYANGTGVYFMNSNIEVTQNQISDSAYGIYSPPDPNTYYGSYDVIAMNISGNRVFNNTEAGICLQGVNFDRSRRLVSNNILYGNVNENIFIRGAILFVQNNTIAGGLNGIRLETSSIFYTYGDIANNIVTNVTGAGVYAGWNVWLSGSLISNVFYNNTSNYYGSVGTPSSDIVADPLLDPVTYHLAAGSPCIDAGVESYYDYYNGQISAPTTDIDGDPRSLALGGDGLFDIGADEYVQ